MDLIPFYLKITIISQLKLTYTYFFLKKLWNLSLFSYSWLIKKQLQNFSLHMGKTIFKVQGSTLKHSRVKFSSTSGHNPDKGKCAKIFTTSKKKKVNLWNIEKQVILINYIVQQHKKNPENFPWPLISFLIQKQIIER